MNNQVTWSEFWSTQNFFMDILEISEYCIKQYMGLNPDDYLNKQLLFQINKLHLSEFGIEINRSMFYFKPLLPSEQSGSNFKTCYVRSCLVQCGLPRPLNVRDNEDLIKRIENKYFK